jgi:hypothetical protein
MPILAMHSVPHHVEPQVEDFFEKLHFAMKRQDDELILLSTADVLSEHLNVVKESLKNLPVSA